MEVERKKKEENEKKGVREIKPRELVQGALRALSVGRILLGALVPGVSRIAYGRMSNGANRVSRVLVGCFDLLGFVGGLRFVPDVGL